MKNELFHSTSKELSINELKQVLKINPKTLEDAVKITNTYNKIKPFLHETSKLLGNTKKGTEQHKYLANKCEKVKELQVKIKHKFPFVKRGNMEIQELLLKELRYVVGEEQFFECLYRAERLLLRKSLDDIELQKNY